MIIIRYNTGTRRSISCQYPTLISHTTEHKGTEASQGVMRGNLDASSSPILLSLVVTSSLDPISATALLTSVAGSWVGPVLVKAKMLSAGVNVLGWRGL